MIVDNHNILKTILLQELDSVDTKITTFEDNPMAFILNKYKGLKKTLEYLMTPSFGEYITAIYVVAPKPTTFKIVLHNGQFFFLQFMGKAYQATIHGKNYYLMTIGEKERAMIAISRLLRFGNPLKTKGPDGAEQSTREAQGPESELGAEATPEESPESAPEELSELSNIENNMKLTNLSEIKILEALLLKEADTSGSTDAERVLAILINLKNIIKNEEQMSAFLSNQKDEDSKFLITYIKKNMKIAGDPVNIYFNALKNIPVTNNAKQLGSGRYKTTSKWQNYGGIKSATSKTDVATDGPNYSVKNGATTVRVLDASAPQIVALINYSIDKSGYSKDIKTELEKNVNKITKLAKSDTFNLSRIYKKQKYGLGDLRLIQNKNLQALIEGFDKNAAELNKVTNTIFKKAQTDPKFNITFIYESITGKEMFGDDSLGAADYVLTFSNNFQNINEYKMSDMAKKISTTFSVPKFGTKSSGTRITKTIQQFYKEKPIKENLDEIINDFNKLVLFEDKLVNNKILLEADVLKKGIDYIKNKFKEILDRISNFFKDLIESLKVLINQSFNKALNLLGIETVIDESTVEFDAGITYDQL